MASSDASSLCFACDKRGARRCGKCKSARYCSTLCQKEDWPTHKLVCASFSNHAGSSRPTEEHFRVLLFPVDGKPEVIWHASRWLNGDQEDERYQSFDQKSILGSDALPRGSPIQYNPALKRQLLNTIYICHRDTFLIDGSKLNHSIARVASTKPGQCRDWRGPIFAYGMIGLGIDQKKCRDLDMDDFRHIFDYFLSYNYTPATITEASIKAVRINCLGDQKIGNKPAFEPVEILSADPIFNNHDVSGIANRIGLPIFTRRLPPNPAWVNGQDDKIFNNEYSFNNQDATYLHLCCDPNASFNSETGALGWGLASFQWQMDVGSVLVVRQDRKPLYPLHVEALCKYCRYDIMPLFAHSMGEYEPEEPLGKEVVLAMICRPTFVLSWYKLLDEKINRGEGEDAPYPYDTE